MIFNAQGVDNSDVIKPWMNALDITRIHRDMWIIDFGDRDIIEAQYYELPFAYVEKHIKPIREKNNDRQRRTFWWRLGRSGSEFKQAKAGLYRIAVTPRLAKHRVFVWASINLVPDTQLVAFVRDDDYFFGVVHSRMHELWARSQGTQLREVESGFRYTPSSTFETFPFPWPPGHEPADDPRVVAIAEAAQRLVELRDAWLNEAGLDAQTLKKRTLTNLYNARPDWLDQAHRQLDQAVLDAYGWPRDIADEEILGRLLALNLERAAADGAAPATAAEDEEDGGEESKNLF